MQAFKSPLPNGFTKDALSAPQKWVRTARVKRCQQGKLIRALVPRVLAGHIGTLCLARTQIPDTQKESRCSA